MVTKINQYTFGNLKIVGCTMAIDAGGNAKLGTVSEPCLEPCPIEKGMRLIGGKWKGTILWHLKDGPVRFNELARQLGGASKKMVNQRLKELEETGLLQRNVISTKPVAVSYEITDEGRSTLHILDALKDWATERGL